MLTDKWEVKSFNVQLTDSMLKYREYLKSSYNSFPLPSPSEKLECNSSEYVIQLFRKFEGNMSKKKKHKREGKLLTLHDVLDVRGRKNNVILIEGRPGMGKSRVANNVCKSWADGEFLQEYDAVILVSLREPEIQEAKDIKDLLLHPDKDVRDVLYKEMMEKNGRRVCFILEGFDELPQTLRDASVFSKLTKKLPRCTLVYTSRPEACEELRSHADCIVEICGFEEEQIEEYIENAFRKVENGKKKAKKLISQVKNNFNVKSILYVPINLAIICHLFLITDQLPNTLTQLYTSLCLNLILRDINRQHDSDAKVRCLHSFDDLPAGTSEQFLNLCLIAYKGIINKRTIFSSGDIEGYDIDARNINDLGLLLIAFKALKCGIERFYSFLHLTIQEFCAAFYISKLSTQEQLECFNKFKFEDNFKMIWRFYSGITGLRNNDLLRQMLPSKLTLVYSHYRGRRTIELLHRVHESQNNDVCKHVGSLLDGKIFLFGCILDINDCTAVTYLFKQCRDLKLVNCRECKVNDGCFKILATSLLSCSGKCSKHLQLDFNYHRLTHDKSSSHLITTLLSSKLPIVSLDIGDYYNLDMVTTLFNSIHRNTKLKELYLNNTDLQPGNMQLLGQALSNNHTLSVLDISENNKIGSDGCQNLANVRNTSLSDLMMSECCVGFDGAGCIGKMLLHNTSIKSINLKGNDIEDDGVKMLAEHLMSNRTLKQIDLSNNNVTSIGAFYLSKLFTRNPCTILHILLDNNPLQDKGVDFILQSITVPMEWVGLCDTKMTLCVDSLSKALRKVKSISFTLPSKCDNIRDTLADTTVLEGLWLKNGINAAYSTMIKGIMRNNSIKTLYFSGGQLYSQNVKDLAKVIELNKTITTIGISCVVVSNIGDYLFLAKALAVNNSIKNVMITIDKNNFKKLKLLEFLKQLKLNNSLELLVFDDTDKTKNKNNDQFNRDVEMSVEGINHARQCRDVTTLLHVNMYVDISEYHYKQVNINIIHYI